ncbi:ribose-5-phosphate isomerase RpiA [Novosphingobium rosa]|uniref:ribose-5-phosphate isomerase RpiA n=1 Tax=Novosphingobium rosa TaxID=76978 RepID=UPI000831F6DC|nr:ribose-5-phosphate isomerase RpiA [Novosphingobium rosa]
MTQAYPTPDDRKRAAAQAAVALIKPGMLVGLGTGSTAAHAVEALGRAVADGLDVRAVATSRATATHAARLGIAVLRPHTVSRIDLCIDGVDEIDPSFLAIKGAGGAMLREKIVAGMATRMIAIADDSKAVARLGGHPVPVEVLPLAQAFVARAVQDLGGDPVPRIDGAGALVKTDQDNIILDARFTGDQDWRAIAARMDAIPGLLGHGLFLDEVHTLCLGGADGAVLTERP